MTGGDESMGGYRRYRMHLGEEAVRGRLPLALRRGMFGPLGRWYPKADWAPRSLRAKTTFQALAMEACRHTATAWSQLRGDERCALFSPAFQRSLGGYGALEVFRLHAGQAQTEDPLALIQYLDYKTWLVGDINTKVDRASMAHSLEVREPLMDHLLVEWLATLPQRLQDSAQARARSSSSRAYEPLLPREVLYRPKMGFSVPLRPGCAAL
ncbi:exosortase 1 system-associated amidotransferase 1 [Alicycliphilus sp. B1]|nr:exosortase 1 system-associated amidotransferase 1 [Alicycliphilus sp. B1]